MNPLRDIVGRLGRQAADRPSPFRAEAELVLSGFREGKRALEAKVARGELTPKVAREQASALASGIGRALKERAGAFSTAPRAFLDRLVEASENHRAAAGRVSLEGLQRETNRLLRSVLVEQQLQARREEFEGRAYVRPVAGGKPAPSLESLLSFHQTATLAGDDAASEWARRQLEALRPVASTPEDHRRIDLATDRPDRINPRLVSTYVEAMQGVGHEALERFVSESISAGDANACTAAFVLAREAPDGGRLRWVRMVLDGIAAFPDAAVTTLRELEANARAAERESATSQADFALAQAESEARMPDLAAPTEADLARRAAIEARPVARLGEPIGLSIRRRGAYEGEDVTGPADGPELA